MVPAMEHYRFLIEDALVSIFLLAMEHYRFLIEDALVSIFLGDGALSVPHGACPSVHFSCSPIHILWFPCVCCSRYPAHKYFGEVAVTGSDPEARAQ
jgi:hypothetical protein